MAVKCMEGPFMFRLNDNGTGPHLLVQVYIFSDKIALFTISETNNWWSSS